MPGAENPTEIDISLTLEPGAVFHERYRIERQLGAGAMGVVYQAEDTLTGQTVALKLINPALVKHPTAAERFIREGTTARDIRHANVVAMYNVGQHGGQLYLVMECLEGMTLRQWLHRNLKHDIDIPLDVARGVVSKILDGLGAAHANQVIHRDLKPENIMLIGDPLEAPDYKLKILDFGIARAIDPDSPTQLTTTSRSTGTPLYMAPEQLTAADTVGPPADLYAVSMIFYEMLIGVPPTGTLQPVSKERAEIPTTVDTFITKGLSRRPRSRYQTVAHYRGGLTRAVFQKPDGQPESETDKKSDIKTGEKSWYRTPLGITSIALGALALLILFNMDAFMEGFRGEDPPLPIPKPYVKPPVDPERKTGLIVDNNGGKIKKPKPKPEPEIDPQPEPDPEPVETNVANISGDWYAELRGMGVASMMARVRQDGGAFAGDIYLPNGLLAGTINGAVRGDQIQYSYLNKIDGSRGRASGIIRSDKQHIDVTVQGPLGTEYHVWHFNHQPH